MLRSIRLSTAFLVGIIAGLLLDRRIPQPGKTALAPQPTDAQEQVQNAIPRRKSRSIDELSPTYAATRDFYMSKAYDGVYESPRKHDRRFRQVLDELDMEDLTELEAKEVKRALLDLFGVFTFQVRETMNTYKIPMYEED